MITNPTLLDGARLTRAQRAALPFNADVALALAERHGVCTRPLAMRRIDTTIGRSDIIPVPCGSAREDQYRPCAEKARRLRMVDSGHANLLVCGHRISPSADS